MKNVHYINFGTPDNSTYVIFGTDIKGSSSSLTLREERKLRVFENKVLRRIFGTRRDEVTGECRRLHNEELNYFVLLTQYCAGDKIEKNEMCWACGAYGRGEGGV